MKKKHMSLDEIKKLFHYREIFKLYLSDIMQIEEEDEINETIEKIKQIIKDCDEIISKYNKRPGVSFNKEAFFAMLTKLNDTVRLRNNNGVNNINPNERKIKRKILSHYREIFKLYLSDIMHLDDEDEINKVIQKAMQIIEDYEEIIYENLINTGESYDEEEYLEMLTKLSETVKLRQYNEDNNIDQNKIERNFIKILAVALAGLIAIAAAGNLKSCSKEEYPTNSSISSTHDDLEFL